MAQIANPAKVFQYAIEIDGLLQFLAQKVTIGDIELESVEHGDTNYSIKTPGRVTVGDIVIEKLMSGTGSDTWAWDWLTAAQNTITGGGLLPLIVKKNITIRRLDSTGGVALNSWIGEGAFPKKIGLSDFDRNSSDNMIETVTLSVDRIRKI